MKILLVRPRQPIDTIGLQHIMVVEPLELEVIGAVVRPPDEVVVVDLILEDRPLEYFLDHERPDLVGFTGYITNVGVVHNLARRTKQTDRRIVTVVGGPHAEICPGDFDIPEIDFRVVRNATTQFPLLIAHVKGNGSLSDGVLRAGQVCDTAALPERDFSYPHPRRELTSRYRSRYFYLYQDRVALMKTSFGCPFSCTFCFCRILTGGRYHARDIGDVLDELQGITEDEIYIVDDDFLISRERVIAFLDGLAVRGIKKSFQVYGRADFIASNPDVIERFRKAGLKVVIVGLESFDDSDLLTYDKRIEARSNIEAIGILNRNDIDVYATIILSPEWTKSDFERLGRHMKRLQIRFANLQPLTPLPGIDMQFDDSQLAERRDDWPKWDLAHVTIRPTQMSVAEFYGETVGLYKKMIWRPANIVKNIVRYPVHMQYRILTGLSRVQRQYELEMRDASNA